MIPTVETLQRATSIVERISALEAELIGLFRGEVRRKPGRPPRGSGNKVEAAVVSAEPKARRRRMSRAGRERIAEAARARWARFRAEREKKKS